jgi:hypothetical protein
LFIKKIMFNRIVSTLLLSTIVAGSLSSVVVSAPKDARDRYRDIAPRGTVLPRNQRAPKVLKLRQPRKARNQATLASVKGFNLSYFEVPTFKEDGPLVREIFDKYKAEGFNAVRIPFRWDDDAATTAPYTINPTLTWGKLNWVMAEARKRGFKIILNIHAYESIMADPAGQEARFLSIWKLQRPIARSHLTSGLRCSMSQKGNSTTTLESGTRCRQKRSRKSAKPIRLD